MFSQIALFGLAVFALLVFSGGWELPAVGENATEAGSAILRLGYLPAYAAGFALIALRPGSTLRVLIRQPFLLVLLTVAVASMFWSVNPDQTVRRCFALVCTTLGGVALAARFRWPQLAEVSFEATNRLWDTGATSADDERVRTYADPRPPFGRIGLVMRRS